MMAKVYKYKLLDSSTVGLEQGIPVMLPRSARVIDVEFQGDICYLWAVVDPKDSSEEERWFIFVGTGINFNEYYTMHLKTLHRNGFVFHVFEVTDAPARNTGAAYETRWA